MTATQVDLWGDQHVAGDVVDKVIALLEDHPEARDSYDLAIALYHWHYDGACYIVAGGLNEWLDWYVTATSDKTIWNRIQDVQKKWRPDLGPSPQAKALRDRQATQGVVR